MRYGILWFMNTLGRLVKPVKGDAISYSTSRLLPCLLMMLSLICGSAYGKRRRSKLAPVYLKKKIILHVLMFSCLYAPYSCFELIFIFSLADPNCHLLKVPNQTRPNGIVTDWTTNSTSWPVCCLSPKMFVLVWISCPCFDSPWVTWRLRASLMVSLSSRTQSCRVALIASFNPISQ